MEKEKTGLSTASLVLGIIGICTSFIPIVNNVSFILGVLAIIFAVISLIKRAGTGKAVAGLVIAIIAIVVTIQSQKALSDGINTISNSIDKATGASTEEVLKNDVEVSLGNFEATTDEYGITNTKLVATVKNKLNESKSFNIHVEAVDSNGNRIAEDYIYANNLGAGQTQQIEIFNLVQSDKVDSLKNANYKIIEASVY